MTLADLSHNHWGLIHHVWALHVAASTCWDLSCEWLYYRDVLLLSWQLCLLCVKSHSEFVYQDLCFILFEYLSTSRWSRFSVLPLSKVWIHGCYRIGYCMWGTSTRWRDPGYGPHHSNWRLPGSSKRKDGKTSTVYNTHLFGSLCRGFTLFLLVSSIIVIVTMLLLSFIWSYILNCSLQMLLVELFMLQNYPILSLGLSYHCNWDAWISTDLFFFHTCCCYIPCLAFSMLPSVIPAGLCSLFVICRLKFSMIHDSCLMNCELIWCKQRTRCSLLYCLKQIICWYLNFFQWKGILPHGFQALIMLWRQLGLPVLAGICCMFAMLAAQISISKYAQKSSRCVRKWS